MKVKSHLSKLTKVPRFVLRAERAMRRVARNVRKQNRAMRRVARNVRKQNRAMNLPLTVWQDGKVVEIPA